MPTDLAAAIEARSAPGIAGAIGRLISSGDLPVGTRLPTVRALAAELGVSPTTVGEAWRLLADAGAVEALGRRGTFVRQAPGPGTGQRYRRVTEGPRATVAVDLSTGTPDPALLPDLAPVLARVAGQDLTGSYLDPPVLPALDEALRSSWPFAPEALTVVDGAMDAVDRVARQVVRLGDRVVVEDPTFPPILDLLEQLGAEVVGVPLDDEGPSLAALERALDDTPSLIVLQPRAHNPTGTTTTARRAEAIARLVGPSSAVVLEDDHHGPLAAGEPVSVGRWLPERTVHVRSFSKSHGPDLRLAAVGGAGGVVDAVAARRAIGPGWSSRILQAVLLALLDDASTAGRVEEARTVYAARRAGLVAALAERGIVVGGHDGINAWVPVADETTATDRLRAAGIGVAPGRPFVVGASAPHVRVTTGLMTDAATADRIAGLIDEA